MCCSFAMLGAAGVVVPAFLTKLGALGVPDWWVAGDIAIKDSGIPLGALISAQMFLMGWAEASRYQVSPQCRAVIHFSVHVCSGAAKCS